MEDLIEENEDVMINPEDPQATAIVMMRSVARTPVLEEAGAENGMEEALGVMAVEVESVNFLKRAPGSVIGRTRNLKKGYYF